MLASQIDVDGHWVETEKYGEVMLIGKATKQPSGKFHCLANVSGALCLIEVTLELEVKES